MFEEGDLGRKKKTFLHGREAFDNSYPGSYQILLAGFVAINSQHNLICTVCLETTGGLNNYVEENSNNPVEAFVLNIIISWLASGRPRLLQGVRRLGHEMCV